jgi:hypothetical protein
MVANEGATQQPTLMVSAADAGRRISAAASPTPAENAANSTPAINVNFEEPPLVTPNLD